MARGAQGRQSLIGLRIRSSSRKNILYGLLLCMLLVIFAAHHLAPFLKPPSFFQIQNFIHIGFFYDDYESSNYNGGGDSVYKTLPMEPGALCNIPSLDPFTPNAIQLIADDEIGKEPLHCLAKEKLVKFYPEHGNLVRVNSPAMLAYWKTVKCCYIGYWGQGNPGNESSVECEPIVSTLTRIPSKYDFINVKCYKWNNTSPDYQDQFEFFRLRQRPNGRDGMLNSASQEQARTNTRQPPNILFIGLDSVSQVNFIRSFPKTHQFLIQQLDALEFHGRNKISVATQGNLMAILTGCKLESGSQIPELLPGGASCELVWNHYRKRSYIVLRAEDDFGLHHQFFPTLRTPKRHLPLTRRQIADYDWTSYIGEMKRLNTAKANQYNFGCFDHQWVQNLLMDRIYNVAEAFNKSQTTHGQPYFHFAWSATTAHDVIGYARFLDDPLYTLLRRLHSKQLLQNTIIVLASDHGMAYGSYSRTNAGSIESRMPLLYFVFPEWMRTDPQYSNAIQNMKTNTMRLTTPFDLYETLIDLSDLQGITNHALQARIPKLSRNKGLSLFFPIPVNRTCESAGIPEEWCICWTKSNIESPSTSSDALGAARVALAELNARLRPFPHCAQLELDGVENARRLSSQLIEKCLYEVVFKTRPGGALFEVSVTKKRGNGAGAFRVLGELVRVNPYGSRSDCLHEYETTTAAGATETRTAATAGGVPYLVNSACHCLDS